DEILRWLALLPVHPQEAHALAAMYFQREECRRIGAAHLKLTHYRPPLGWRLFVAVLSRERFGQHAEPSESVASARACRTAGKCLAAQRTQTSRMLHPPSPCRQRKPWRGGCFGERAEWHGDPGKG